MCELFHITVGSNFQSFDANFELFHITSGSNECLNFDIFSVIHISGGRFEQKMHSENITGNGVFIFRGGQLGQKASQK